MGAGTAKPAVSLRGWFLVLMLLCLQFGVSYHLSVAAFLILVLLISARRTLRLPGPGILAGLGLVFLLPALVYEATQTGSLQFLRTLREMLLCLILLALLQSSHSPPSIEARKWVGYSTAIIVTLVLLQATQQTRGAVLVVPDWLFALKQDGALAYKGLLHSLKHNYMFFFRPSATFSEPSYLGMVCCCLFVMAGRTHTGTQRFTIFALLFMVCVVASTALGILGVLALYGTSVAKENARIAPVVGMLGLVVGFLALFMIGAEKMAPGRLGLLLSGRDISGLARFYEPFALILHNAEHQFFGVPATEAAVYYDRFGLIPALDDPPLHNGLLNLLIFYGYGGLVLLFLLFSSLKTTEERLLLLIVGMQNGEIFSYSKVALLVLVVWVVKSHRHGFRAAVQPVRPSGEVPRVQHA